MNLSQNPVFYGNHIPSQHIIFTLWCMPSRPCCQALLHFCVRKTIFALGIAPDEELSQKPVLCPRLVVFVCEENGGFRRKHLLLLHPHLENTVWQQNKTPGEYKHFSDLRCGDVHWICKGESNQLTKQSNNGYCQKYA